MTFIIIGRFQVPYLHLGHIYLITYALQRAKKVVVFLGCSTTNGDSNPFSIWHRINQIQKLFPQIEVVTVWDRDSDEEWSHMIDMEAMRFPTPTLVHSRDSFRGRYTGLLPAHAIPELPGYSGTDLRKDLEP